MEKRQHDSFMKNLTIKLQIKNVFLMETQETLKTKKTKKFLQSKSDR